jgi:hypothetical protein
MEVTKVSLHVHVVVTTQTTITGQELRALRAPSNAAITIIPIWVVPVLHGAVAEAVVEAAAEVRLPGVLDAVAVIDAPGNEYRKSGILYRSF